MLRPRPALTEPVCCLLDTVVTTWMQSCGCMRIEIYMRSLIQDSRDETSFVGFTTPQESPRGTYQPTWLAGS